MRMSYILGTAGNDNLFDTSEDDQIDALEGDDNITVTGGYVDSVQGRAGTDRLIVDYSHVTGNITSAIAIDALGGYTGYVYDTSAVDAYVAYHGIENFTITAGSGNDLIAAGAG